MLLLLLAHFTTIEEVVRWAVIILGFAVIATSLIVMAIREIPRTQFVLVSAMALTAMGISINYIIGHPVLYPGALFYLAAYLGVLIHFGEIFWKRHSTSKVKDSDGRSTLAS